jgi:hypothetical protein
VIETILWTLLIVGGAGLCGLLLWHLVTRLIVRLLRTGDD